MTRQKETDDACPARFNDYIVRELPKSTQEIELELMEYYRANPFRAKPIRCQKSNEKKEPEITSGRQKSFREIPKSFEQIETELMEEIRSKPFRASPIRFRIPKTTTSDENTDPSERTEDSFTMEKHEGKLHDSISNESMKRKITVPESFTLHTEERIKKRKERQKLEEEVSESTNDEEGTIRRSSYSSSKGPIKLASEARHELYLQRWEEKLRFEEEERRKLSQFRAREWNRESFEYNGDKKKYLRSNNKHVHVEPEEVDPNKELQKVLERYKANNIGSFELESVQRHILYQRQFSERIKMEEEINQQLAEIKSVSSWGSFISFASSKILKRISYKVSSIEESRNKEFLTTTDPIVDEPVSEAFAMINNEQKALSHPPQEIHSATSNSFERNDSLEPFVFQEELDDLSKDLQSSLTPESLAEDLPSAYYPSITLSLVLAVGLFRILNTFLVQTYYDPDEFWQMLEPAYCMVFYGNSNGVSNNHPPAVCPGLTWEWKRNEGSLSMNLFERSMLGPARSYLSIVPVYWYYQFLKYFSIDTNWLVARGPMIVSAITVAAPIDLCIYFIGRWLMGQSKKNSNVDATKREDNTLPFWCLFCTLSSWYNGYTLVRTFANCQETLLVIMAVALVSPELIANTPNNNFLFRSCLAFLLGGIAATIRHTALALFVPMGFILALRKKSIVSTISFLLLPCATFGLFGLMIGLVVDRIFFGFWTLPLLGNFHFNVILNNAGLYGVHSIHWYFSSGLPAITGLLLPFVLYDFWLCFFNAKRLEPSATYGRRNLWILIICYLAILSFNVHKEFRFILPILPLLCLISASHMRSLCTKVTGGNQHRYRLVVLCGTFAMVNLIALCYLGLFHQKGPISVNSMVTRLAKELYTADTRQSSFSVHYLTGSCHSTPLLSHLHSPPISLADNIWHLDCSPDCRSNPNQVCESDQFRIDPVSFIEKHYFPCKHTKLFTRISCLEERNLKKRLIPDFIVTFSEFVEPTKRTFASEGFQEVSRFYHSINGLRLLNGQITLDSNNNFGKVGYRSYTFLNGAIDVSVEEMVIFARKTLEPVCV